MTPAVAVALGFVAGLGVAALFWAFARRRVPAAAKVEAAAAVANPAATPPPPETNVEREVAAVWLQFLRREVGDTVGAINTRLTVVKTLLQGIAANPSSEEQTTVERIGVELDRAIAATDTLHTHVSSTAPERARPSISAVHPHASREGIVLLVESDDTSRDVLDQLFRRLGHRVIPAQNGVEALAILEREPVDCVVSETRASQVSGQALHAQVEERLPHLCRRFVFISGDTQVPEVRAFLDRCNCPVIPKPFDVALLVEAVSAVLDEAARERDAHETAPRVAPPSVGASERRV